MRSFALFALVATCVTTPTFAQNQGQPNSADASLVFAGMDHAAGQNGPICAFWDSLVFNMEIQGPPNMPYTLAHVPNDPANGTTGFINMQTCTEVNNGTFVGSNIGLGSLDIDLGHPLASYPLDGSGQGLSGGNPWDVLANTGPSGSSFWVFPITSNQDMGCFQAGVWNPAAPNGITFTAATHLDIAAANRLYIYGGDDSWTQVNLLFDQATFYDQTYDDLYIDSNGCLTFGAPDGTPWDSTLTGATGNFAMGPARMAPIWADLLPGATIGGAPFIGVFYETPTGFTAKWVLMWNWQSPGGPTSPGVNTATSGFNCSFDYASGTISFDYSTGAVGDFTSTIPGSLQVDYGIIGITPGSGLASGRTLFNEATDPLVAGGNGTLPGAGPLNEVATDESIGVIDFQSITNYNGTTYAGGGAPYTINFVPGIYVAGSTANTYIMQ